jgi:UBA/TS-N domain
MKTELSPKRTVSAPRVSSTPKTPAARAEVAAVPSAKKSRTRMTKYELLATLQDQGFSPEAALHAMSVVGSDSLPAVVAWLLAQPPKTTDSPAESSGEQNIPLLMQMGFTERHARAALRASRGLLVGAQNWSIENIAEIDEAVRRQDALRRC